MAPHKLEIGLRDLLGCPRKALGSLPSELWTRLKYCKKFSCFPNYVNNRENMPFRGCERRRGAAGRRGTAGPVEGELEWSEQKVGRARLAQAPPCPPLSLLPHSLPRPHVPPSPRETARPHHRDGRSSGRGTREGNTGI